MMAKRLLVVSAVATILLACNHSSAQVQTSLTVIPVPTTVVFGPGQLSLDHGLGIVFEGYTEPRLERARDRFRQVLARKTGIPNLPAQTSSLPMVVVRTAGPSATVQQLGEDETYHLTVSTTGVSIAAANPLGVLHGLQTLLQLVQTTPAGYAIGAVTIDDKPRFPWRGLMIDVGRHFMPLEIIRANLDGMEAVKMNVFHWHLSDDQGFRIESKTYPLLQLRGSDGLYYSQDQVKDILAYARDRGIRVIPEFDMPAHATSWFVGYPNLASGSGPYQIQRHWGVFDPAMDPTRESTYAFLERFIAEMTALFPDAYFHIGGDECNGKEWSSNPRIREYMQSHQMKDNAALQAYFTGRVQKLVANRQKIAVGWDEVLQPDTPRNVVIQSWRGQDSLAEAARRGYRGILSAGYYIDLNQSAADHYAVDPLRNSGAPLSSAEQANILGGEATMWSEFVSPENVNSRIWPRTAVIAERLWSKAEVRDTDSMYNRLDRFSRELAYYGLNHRASSEQMLTRLSGDANPRALEVLASVVQPPRDYAREDLAPSDAFSPLNRLVDAVPPESEMARQFNDLAQRIASGGAAPADWQIAHDCLEVWRNNDPKLQPSLSQSALTAELIPLSRNLAAVANIGLSALDTLQKKQPITVAARDRQLAELKALERPEAVLLLKIIPGVELLVRTNQSR